MASTLSSPSGLGNCLPNWLSTVARSALARLKVAPKLDQRLPARLGLLHPLRNIGFRERLDVEGDLAVKGGARVFPAKANNRL
ncbi:MAG TPA: hypothetical protein VMQ56_02520 [Terracidiphilus sp.]|jgi:hypothetical protein|nr:hypothetical protein [Terracidiphilus sp.]